MATHRDGVSARFPRDPIKLALAVGLAGALIILAMCIGCGGLIALGNANAPAPTYTVPTTPGPVTTGGTP